LTDSPNNGIARFDKSKCSQDLDKERPSV
jgi:hypothetical protein